MFEVFCIYNNNDYHRDQEADADDEDHVPQSVIDADANTLPYVLHEVTCKHAVVLLEQNVDCIVF